MGGVSTTLMSIPFGLLLTRWTTPIDFDCLGIGTGMQTLFITVLIVTPSARHTPPRDVYYGIPSLYSISILISNDTQVAILASPSCWRMLTVDHGALKVL